MPKKPFLQIVSRENEHINSVNVTWKLGTRGKVKMLQKLGKFLFRVNFNGFLLGLDKLTLFKPC